jgi:protein TonB
MPRRLVPSPAPRPAALPLAGSLALHGLVAAALAGVGFWWLKDPEQPVAPPELAVAPREESPSVEEPPAPVFEIVPEAWQEPEVVPAEVAPLERLDEVEILLPRPPVRPFPDTVWTQPAPIEPVAEEPKETPPAEPAPAPAEVDRAAVEPPQVDAAHCPPPAYPRAARRMGQEGVVEILVTVGADGRPTAVAVHHSSGFPLLDDAALEAVQAWRFHPAHRADGTVMAGELVVPLRFRIGDA